MEQNTIKKPRVVRKRKISEGVRVPDPHWARLGTTA